MPFKLQVLAGLFLLVFTVLAEKEIFSRCLQSDFINVLSMDSVDSMITAIEEDEQAKITLYSVGGLGTIQGKKQGFFSSFIQGSLACKNVHLAAIPKMDAGVQGIAISPSFIFVFGLITPLYETDLNLATSTNLIIKYDKYIPTKEPQIMRVDFNGVKVGSIGENQILAAPMKALSDTQLAILSQNEFRFVNFAAQKMHGYYVPKFEDIQIKFQFFSSWESQELSDLGQKRSYIFLLYDEQNFETQDQFIAFDRFTVTHGKQFGFDQEGAFVNFQGNLAKIRRGKVQEGRDFGGVLNVEADPTSGVLNLLTCVNREDSTTNQSQNLFAMLTLQGGSTVIKYVMSKEHEEMNLCADAKIDKNDIYIGRFVLVKPYFVSILSVHFKRGLVKLQSSKKVNDDFKYNLNVNHISKTVSFMNENHFGLINLSTELNEQSFKSEKMQLLQTIQSNEKRRINPLLEKESKLLTISVEFQSSNFRGVFVKKQNSLILNDKDVYESGLSSITQIDLSIFDYNPEAIILKSQWLNKVCPNSLGKSVITNVDILTGINYQFKFGNVQEMTPTQKICYPQVLLTANEEFSIDYIITPLSQIINLNSFFYNIDLSYKAQSVKFKFLAASDAYQLSSEQLADPKFKITQQSTFKKEQDPKKQEENFKFVVIRPNNQAPQFEKEIPKRIGFQFGKPYEFKLPTIVDPNKDQVSVFLNNQQVPFLQYNPETNSLQVESDSTTVENLGSYSVKLIVQDDFEDRPERTEYPIKVQVVTQIEESFEDYAYDDSKKEEQTKDDSRIPKARLDRFTSSGILTITFSKNIEFSTGLKQKINRDNYPVVLESGQEYEIQQIDEFGETIVIPLISVQIEAGRDSFTNDLKFTWSCIEVYSSQIQLIFEFENSLLISQESYPEIVKVELNLQKYVDSNGLGIADGTKLQMNIPKQMPRTAGSETLTATSSNIKGSASTIMSFNGIFNILLNTSLSQLWTLLNGLQIIAHFPMHNVKYPGNTLALLIPMVQVANFDIFPHDLIFPYIFDFPDSNGFNESFNETGYESGFLPENMSTNFVISFGLIIIFTLALISLYACKKEGRVRRALNKFDAWFNRKIAFVGFFRFFFESYLEISLSSWAVIVRPYWSNDPAAQNLLHFNLTLGILYFIFSMITPTCIVYWHLRNIDKLFEREYMRKYGAGYNTISDKRAKLAIFQIFYFVFRRFLFVLTVIFLETQPFVQLFITGLTASIQCIFIFEYQPFISPQENKIEMFNELTLISLVYTSLCFSEITPSAEAQYGIGWFFISVVILNLMVHFWVLTGDNIRKGCLVFLLNLKKIKIFRPFEKQIVQSVYQPIMAVVDRAAPPQESGSQEPNEQSLAFQRALSRLYIDTDQEEAMRDYYENFESDGEILPPGIQIEMGDWNLDIPHLQQLQDNIQNEPVKKKKSKRKRQEKVVKEKVLAPIPEVVSYSKQDTLQLASSLLKIKKDTLKKPKEQVPQLMEEQIQIELQNQSTKRNEVKETGQFNSGIGNSEKHQTYQWLDAQKHVSEKIQEKKLADKLQVQKHFNKSSIGVEKEAKISISQLDSYHKLSEEEREDYKSVDIEQFEEQFSEITGKKDHNHEQAQVKDGINIAPKGIWLEAVDAVRGSSMSQRENLNKHKSAKSQKQLLSVNINLDPIDAPAYNVNLENPKSHRFNSGIEESLTPKLKKDGVENKSNSLLLPQNRQSSAQPHTERSRSNSSSSQRSIISKASNSKFKVSHVHIGSKKASSGSKKSMSNQQNQ